MKALVDSNTANTVVQMVEDGDEFDVHPSLVWHDAPEGCEFGWQLKDGVLVAGPAKETVDARITYKEHRERDFSRLTLIGDQLDDLYHEGAFGASMTAKIKAIKDKWPKDNSGPVE